MFSLLHVNFFFSEKSKSPWYQQGENGELEFLGRHKKFILEIQKVSYGAWLNSGRFKDFESERDAYLFLSRYSKQLKISIKCNRCNDDISKEHVKCLECKDVELCGECHGSYQEPDGHVVTHTMVKLR